jgi:hypothetical protein
VAGPCDDGMDILKQKPCCGGLVMTLTLPCRSEANHGSLTASRLPMLAEAASLPSVSDQRYTLFVGFCMVQ